MKYENPQRKSERKKMVADTEQQSVTLLAKSTLEKLKAEAKKRKWNAPQLKLPGDNNKRITS